MAFDADGTIVAAWANPDGGRVALRRPGQTTFDAAAGLGRAFSLDLKPTPQGRTALAFAADGIVSAALQAPDGSFTPTAIGRSSGRLTPQPSISVDAAGGIFVLYADGHSGEVRAVTAGRTTTVIGYGRPETLIAGSVAAGAANTAFAVWEDDRGGVSSATYGQDAPPAGGPGPRPAPADRVAPRVRLTSTRRVTVSARTTVVKLKVSCSEACAIGADANLRTAVLGSRRRVAPIPTVDIRRARWRPAGVRTVTLKLGSLALKDLRRALKARRGGQLFLTINAIDKNGNRARVKTTLTLRARARA